MTIENHSDISRYYRKSEIFIATHSLEEMFEMVYQLRGLLLTILLRVSIILFQILLFTGGNQIFNNLLVNVIAIRNMIMLVKMN